MLYVGDFDSRRKLYAVIDTDDNSVEWSPASEVFKAVAGYKLHILGVETLQTRGNTKYQMRISVVTSDGRPVVKKGAKFIDWVDVSGMMGYRR